VRAADGSGPAAPAVNQWHWAETDAVAWCEAWLRARAEGLEAKKGACAVRVTALESCTGEAYINRRKGKVIPGYELKVALTWEASEPAGVRGSVLYPYVADENAGDKHESRVTLAEGCEGDPRADEAKRHVAAELVPQLHKLLGAFEEEMAKGGPTAGGAAPPEGAGNGAGKGSGTPHHSEAKAGAPKPAAAPPKKEDPKAGKTLRMEERYFCRPGDIYEAYLDEGRVRHFTQSDCRISREAPGGEFMLFGGRVTGTNVELKEGQLIVQKWRFADWEDGVFSTVTIAISEPERGSTLVTLTQTGIPLADRFGNETVFDTTENGWKNLIWNRIRQCFGYGA